VRQRQIGDVKVSAIGLGEMPLSLSSRPDRRQAVDTVRAALDAGVTLIDTADAYCADSGDFGHGEELVAEALRAAGRSARDVLVATKGGHTRTADGGWTLDGRPEYLRQACEASLRRLGVEAIGLYQFHRPDPRVPYEESVGVLAELLDAGKIRMAGISNADPGQIRAAQQILGGRLVSVQNQFSPSFRSSEPELRRCDELGIAFLPWSPLGGISRAAALGTSGGPSTAGAIGEVAAARGVSPQQVALAWMLAKSPVVIPIPGSSRPDTIRDSAAAAELDLTPEELAKLG
jgi:aryl-alcohol dehydrogenase-like predicted oxidoreductase